MIRSRTKSSVVGVAPRVTVKTLWAELHSLILAPCFRVLLGLTLCAYKGGMSGVLQSPDRKFAALQSNGSKLILLVDDSYAERLAIRSGIELLTGFRVCEASNGAEAI